MFVLIVTTLANAWLLMQVVHELGHLLAGWLTGGDVLRVVLHPLTISRTDLAANPSPVIVCWAGPVCGVLAPVVVWFAAQWRNLACAFWLRFFAGFCLIANGAYLSVGMWEGIGDAGDLLKHGSPAWTLLLFGAVTIPPGLWLWNGLGPRFGLGANGDPVTWRAAGLSTALLVTTIGVEVACGLVWS
jgi:hypothetical protein